MLDTIQEEVADVKNRQNSAVLSVDGKFLDRRKKTHHLKR